MAQSQQAHRTSLSSGRIKYADPKSLPSYPSLGLSKDDSATAAATIGWARQSMRHSNSCRAPRRSTIPTPAPPPTSACAAAASAADSETPSRRRPNHQGAREPAANTSCHANGGAAPRRRGNSASQEGFGSSAAYLAFKSQQQLQVAGTGSKATTADERSLTAAREAVRPRSVSSPVLRQRASTLDEGPGAYRWTLAPGSPDASEARTGAVTALPRSMYTANPPVGLEIEEKKKAGEIHSSAVAMARRIYLQQQQRDKEGPVHDADDLQSRSSYAPPSEPQPSDLHEAAYKLAQERLAKLQDEHRRNRDLQEYYAPAPNNPSPRRRFSIVSKLRRRSSSDSDAVLRRRGTVHVPGRIAVPPPDDVDEERRQKDREALLAAARRNVRSQLDEMDQGVADRTGMVPPSRKQEWEPSAYAIAHAKIAADEDLNKGKRDIGGGRYMAQEDIDAIAAAHVQPTLKEMDERAAAERERCRAAVEAEEARKLEADVEKAHNKEIKDIYRRLKGEQKEKDAERRRILREEDQKWKRLSRDGDEAVREAIAESQYGRRSLEPPRTPSPTEEPAARTENAKEGALSPGKVKNWLKAKLSRQKPAPTEPDTSELGKGFVGGHMLRTPGGSSHSLLPAPSMREVAVAGRSRQALGEAPVLVRGTEPRDGATEGVEQRSARGVSSSPGTGDEFEDAKETLSPDTTPGRRMRVEMPGQNRSPTRDSRFVEHVD